MRNNVIIIASICFILSCASSDFGKPCSLTQDQNTTALENIRAFMIASPDIEHKDYINGELKQRGEYNSSKHCTFVITPNQPISTGFIWDGAWAIQVDKETLEVNRHYRIDMK
jgi:hypothetical protein